MSDIKATLFVVRVVPEPLRDSPNVPLSFVSDVPFFHTPDVVFAVHPPSIIRLLIRLIVELCVYSPLAIRIITGLSGSEEAILLARFKAPVSVFTGLVVLPSPLASLPDVEQYIILVSQGEFTPPDISCRSILIRYSAVTSAS